MWLSTDPALGEYIPGLDKDKNKNLPGMGGLFNQINANLFHAFGNNPIRYRDPDGRADNLHDRITKSVNDNINYNSTDSMACDKFVTKVLADANALPKNWPDPDWTNVKGYREFMKHDLSNIASTGWNVVVMISDNSTMVDIYGRTLSTDPTPHLGLMLKREHGELTLVHYTHGKVQIQSFKNEKDFLKKMPFEVYVYDTAEYKGLETN